ncbi:MAG: insulinase family protein [Oscillospiraceae bacterium]|nr:insulinase family protein [Oscillospiraceae bacterium]
MKNTVKSNRLGESYLRVEHPSGLTMLLCPMKGFSSAYAMFGTKYGSVDTTFKTDADEDYITVPEGIAHFLEHKLFESEDGDAFARYAATGASANAYTSFDRTAYLFSCTENFKESMEILLDFVTHPYFTQQTVEKEQGIIGQEIRMYDDVADWRVMFGLLGSLYHNHPVRIDIAGTVESIAQIDADLLYRCYNTFYNLRNMVLVVAGNFDPDVVIKLADKILKPAPPMSISRKSPPEPDTVAKTRTEVSLPISMPVFQLGFKGTPGDAARNLKSQVENEILLEIIAGESSHLYRRLYDQGLINATFSFEVMAGRDYLASLYEGESRDPDAVAAAIRQEVARLRAEGIDPEDFARCKRAAYGRYIGMFAKVEAIAGLMMLAEFAGVDMYEFPEWVANVTLEDLTLRLQQDFDPERSALSVVTPSK